MVDMKNEESGIKRNTKKKPSAEQKDSIKRGLQLILMSIGILILVIAIHIEKSNSQEKNSEVNTLLSEVTTVIETQEGNETVTEDTTATVIPEVTSEGGEDFTHEKEEYRTINVRNIPEEYITLLELSEEEIKTQLITFANSYGFARAREIGSMGTITINTNEDAVYAGFFYYLEDDSYFKFDLVYVRRTGKFEFKPW